MAAGGSARGGSGWVPIGEDEGRVRQFTWRIAVVEDHLLQRRAMVDLLCAQSGVRSVWDGESLPQFLEWLDVRSAGGRPHLLVLDLHVDRGPVLDPTVVRELVSSGMRVMVVSAMGHPELVRAILRAGVTGVVGKRDTPDDIVAAMWTVLGRGRWMSRELADVVGPTADKPLLSDQEERALVLYASGNTLESVAEALGVQRNTAKKYLSRVKAKYAALGRTVRTKVELNVAARQDGFISDDTPREQSLKSREQAAKSIEPSLRRAQRRTE